MEIKRTFTQSIDAKAEDALLLEILPTKRASITSGLVITGVLLALDAPITISVFVFSMTLSIMAAISQNSWLGGMFCTRHQFQKTDDVDNFEQIGVVCRCTGHEFIIKLPKDMLKYFILAS